VEVLVLRTQDEIITIVSPHNHRLELTAALREIMRPRSLAWASGSQKMTALIDIGVLIRIVHVYRQEVSPCRKN